MYQTPEWQDNQEGRSTRLKTQQKRRNTIKKKRGVAFMTADSNIPVLPTYIHNHQTEDTHTVNFPSFPKRERVED